MIFIPVLYSIFAANCNTEYTSVWSGTLIITFTLRSINNSMIFFDSLQDAIRVIPSEVTLIFFRVLNNHSNYISCLTIYTIYPTSLLAYIKKVQCFCFDTLLLLPMESVDLPVLFYIVPAITEQIVYNRINFLYSMIINLNL